MQSTFEELQPSTNDYTRPGLSWATKDYQADQCTGTMTADTTTGDIIIKGRVTTNDINRVMYWASAPPTYGTSFSGSGMPYPNPATAFDRTPNRGVVELNSIGEFTFRIKYPNAYYVGLGSLYVPPHVNLKLCVAGLDEADPANKTVSLTIDEGIPFRLLTYPAPPSKKPRTGPMFYCEPCQGARTQEAILRASGYPEKNVMPDNFWGTKPPC